MNSLLNEIGQRGEEREKSRRIKREKDAEENKLNEKRGTHTDISTSCIRPEGTKPATHLDVRLCVCDGVWRCVCVYHPVYTSQPKANSFVCFPEENQALSW